MSEEVEVESAGPERTVYYRAEWSGERVYSPYATRRTMRFRSVGDPTLLTQSLEKLPYKNVSFSSLEELAATGLERGLVMLNPVGNSRRVITVTPSDIVIIYHGHAYKYTIHILLERNRIVIVRTPDAFYKEYYDNNIKPKKYIGAIRPTEFFWLPFVNVTLLSIIAVALVRELLTATMRMEALKRVLRETGLPRIFDAKLDVGVALPEEVEEP